MCLFDLFCFLFYVLCSFSCFVHSHLHCEASEYLSVKYSGITHKTSFLVCPVLSCWFQIFHFQVCQDYSFFLLSSRRTRRETITSSISSVRQLNCPSLRLCSLVSHMCSSHTVHFTRGRHETLWKVVVFLLKTIDSFS